MIYKKRLVPGNAAAFNRYIPTLMVEKDCVSLNHYDQNNQNRQQDGQNNFEC